MYLIYLRLHLLLNLREQTFLSLYVILFVCFLSGFRHFSKAQCSDFASDLCSSQLSPSGDLRL